MSVTALEIEAVKLITPRIFRDERGFFSETYNRKALAQAGIDVDFVQDNHSLSRSKGVVRGLHFQIAPKAQGKLVRVTRGSILDVGGRSAHGLTHLRAARFCCSFSGQLVAAVGAGRLRAWLLHTGRRYRGDLQGHERLRAGL